MIKKNKLLERKNQLHEKKLNKGTHRMKERGGGERSGSKRATMEAK